jgi:hypothetical protein
MLSITAPMLDLRRPLERGIMKEGSEKDQEAVQEILRHLIGLAGYKAKEQKQSEGARGRRRAR